MMASSLSAHNGSYAGKSTARAVTDGHQLHLWANIDIERRNQSIGIGRMKKIRSKGLSCVELRNQCTPSWLKGIAQDAICRFVLDQVYVFLATLHRHSTMNGTCEQVLNWYKSFITDDLILLRIEGQSYWFFPRSAGFCPHRSPAEMRAVKFAAVR